jgi:hypothetical protein
MIRNHLKIFHDEQWSHLLQEHYGIRTRPNIIRHNFSWTKPQRSLLTGFKNNKPKIFVDIDKLIQVRYLFDTVFNAENFIQLADNRMKMGDFRYGNLQNQRLDLFDVKAELIKRMNRSYQTKNKEDVLDTYNMYRIEAFKQDKIIWDITMWLGFLTLLNISENEHWPLIHIDDGEHAY